MKFFSSTKIHGVLLAWLILFFPAASIAELSCDIPLKGQIFNASLVESGNFNVNLSSVYTTDQIIQIENNLTACQSLISSRISLYQEKVSLLIGNKATLEGFRNLEDQINRIKTLEGEKKSIQEAFMEDLSQITLKGLYAVIIEAHARVPRDLLIDAAKKIIAPQAINDLRGIAVNSITVVEGSRLVFDRIKTETSGEMDIEAVKIEERKFFKGKTQLLYVGIVRVNPLKGKVRGETKSQEIIQASVADVLSGKGISGFQQELAKFTNEAYATEQMVSIKEKVSISQDFIRQHNIQGTKKEGELLIQLAERLSEKDKEVQLEQGKVNDKRKKLRDNFSRVGFICNREPETCLPEAITFMDKKVQAVVDESLKEKGREYLGTKEVVRGTGDPENEIHRLTKDLFKNLKTTYGKREQFLSVTVVDKMMLTKAEDRQGYYIVRRPNEVSLYPYNDDKGDMHLLLVMNFFTERDNLTPNAVSKSKPQQKPDEENNVKGRKTSEDERDKLATKGKAKIDGESLSAKAYSKAEEKDNKDIIFFNALKNIRKQGLVSEVSKPKLIKSYIGTAELEVSFSVKWNQPFIENLREALFKFSNPSHEPISWARCKGICFTKNSLMGQDRVQISAPLLDNSMVFDSAQIFRGFFDKLRFTIRFQDENKQNIWVWEQPGGEKTVLRELYAKSGDNYTLITDGVFYYAARVQLETDLLKDIKYVQVGYVFE